MKVIHITIDEPLLEEVDRLTAALKIPRSAFIRDALRAAIRRHTIAALEKQHARAYALHPQEPDEVDIWFPEEVRGEE